MEEKINNLLVETLEEEFDPELWRKSQWNSRGYEQESSSDNDNIPTVNVLTKEQDLLFEVINSILDPNEKRTYLNKFKQTLEQTSRKNLLVTNININIYIYIYIYIYI